MYSLEKPFFQDKKLFRVPWNLSCESYSNQGNICVFDIFRPLYICGESFEEYKSNFINKLICYETLENRTICILIT